MGREARGSSRGYLAAVAFCLAGCSSSSTPSLADALSDGPRADTAMEATATVEKLSAADASKTSDLPSMPAATFASIPAGSFAMGSPSSEPCRNDDEDLHTVTLTHAFKMQTTEVTQDQFQQVMGYNSSASKKSCGGSCPVEKVTWNEAAAFCNKLSAIKGLTACYACTGSGTQIICPEDASYTGAKVYKCPGFRLPTEAEWEYAYRAGTSTAYYDGANDATVCTSCATVDANLDTIAWYCQNSGMKLHVVGTKAANAWGLYDMAGNLFEWCHDTYQVSLGTSAVTDPGGAVAGSFRVVRGGALNYAPGDQRGAARERIGAPWRSDSLGFRCVIGTP
jgi:formylglycine-generating enzyme